MDTRDTAVPTADGGAVAAEMSRLSPRERNDIRLRVIELEVEIEQLRHYRDIASERGLVELEQALRLALTHMEYARTELAQLVAVAAYGQARIHTTEP